MLAYIGLRVDAEELVRPDVFTIPAGGEEVGYRRRVPDDGASTRPTGGGSTSTRSGYGPPRPPTDACGPTGPASALTRRARELVPHVSPDGSRLAYVSSSGTEGIRGPRRDRRLCGPDGTGIRDLVRVHGGGHDEREQLVARSLPRLRRLSRERPSRLSRPCRYPARSRTQQTGPSSRCGAPWNISPSPDTPSPSPPPRSPPPSCGAVSTRSASHAARRPPRSSRP